MKPKNVTSISAALSVVLAGCLSAPANATTHESFYTPPSTFDGNPGDLIRAENSVFYLDPLRLIKVNARVQRLMYVSTGIAGERTAVTGMVLTPTARWREPGPRPLVSYAPATQGMADRCAPSRQLAIGWEYEALLVKGILANGYSVAITDYQGLGTPGTHPYVNAPVLGKNVLDIARAAKRLDTDRVADTAPVYIMGYSEGGNAAAGALERRRSYAPELTVKAGVVGAAPANLEQVASGMDGSLYVAFGLYAVAAVADLYPQLRVPDLLNAAGQTALEAVKQTCLADGLAAFAFTTSQSLTTDGSTLQDVLKRPDIAAVLSSMQLGRTAPDVPVLISHSRRDNVVPFSQGESLQKAWAARGATVTLVAWNAPLHLVGFISTWLSAISFFSANR